MKVTILRHPILSLVYASCLLGSLIGGLAAILSFHLIEKPRQYEVAQRAADLRMHRASDKAHFIEGRLKIESVLDADVLKLLGRPVQTSESFAEVQPRAKEKTVTGDRLLMWHIGEGNVWGVLVRDVVVVATYRPGPAFPLKILQALPTVTEREENRKKPTAAGEKSPTTAHR